MTKFTIVYTDGYEEHYHLIPAKNVTDATRMKHFKEIIEDDMLKLVVEDSQIVLIPMANIRKIISQSGDMDVSKMEEFPGFLNVKIAD